MYRIALVEYLNTFPFSEGIRITGLEEQAEIHRVIPALCAQLFQERKVDVSLCPVGALNDMPDYEIRGKYCIGANGKVDTVVLLSQVPLEEITRVRLDDHSRTSNLLLQVLAKWHWKKDWKYYFNGHDAIAPTCLMIGDKVFSYKNEFAYSYDLAELWKEMTGLPMVFALWIAKPDTDEDIIRQIDEAFEKGMAIVESGESSLEQWQRDYLLHSISYPLDDQKMEALKLFRKYIGELL